MNIGIVGGGISGVSLASKLALMKKNGKDISVTLLEAADKIGGTVYTVQKDGFVIEAGTNGFLDSKPFTTEVFTDAGLSHKLVKSNDKARKRYIQRYGALQRMPENGPAFFASKLLTWSGKFRLAMEFFVPQKKDDTDETLAHFARRRLGSQALDYLIGPMVSGVFAGDPEKMSLVSSFPVIADLEKTYGGLFKGMIKKRNKKSGPAGPGGVLTAYEGGMFWAVNDLANFCTANGVNIVKNAPVTKITKVNGKYLAETPEKTFEFDQIAICCPAYESAKFLKYLNGELAETLGSIPYAPIFVTGMGFNSEDIEDEIDGFGYLIPAKENRDILGCLFTSSMFPVQAPTGKKFLRIMAGGDRRRDLMSKTDTELLDICLRDVSDVLRIKHKPYMVQYFRYENAIPQYYTGHRDKVAKIEKITSELGGIYVGGNVLYGIGLNDCTKTSKMIADKIAASLIN